MFQQQLAGALAQSFVDMLFSSTPKADEQKQKMMEQLQKEQALAEQQHKQEEARKLAEICTHLQATLKLEGLPSLKLQLSGSPDSSGLHLKLGDEDDRHAGVAGLPGIYLNGPATPANSSSDNSLGLKIGEDQTWQAKPGVLANTTAPQGTTASAPSGPADVYNMSPEQLAALAKQVNNLPPEQQQKLMDAAKAAAAPASEPPAQAGAEAGSPAAGQLQQVAASSQAAAGAATPEAMVTKAGSGFDTPGEAVVPLGHAESPAQAPAQPLVQEPVAPLAASLPAAKPAAPTNAPAHTSAAPVVALSLGPGSAGRASVAPGVPILSASETLTTQAPSRIALMSNEQLKAETCRARTMLEGIGKSSLEQSQTMESETRQEIREMKKEAVDAGGKCFSEMLEKFVDDKMDELEAKEKKEHPSPNFEGNWGEKLEKLKDLQKDLNKANGDYAMSEKEREDKLDAALGYMNGLYEYVRKTKPVPWVSTLQCAIDFGYVATRIYLAEEQMEMLNRNLDGPAGVLKAESAVAGFYKKLVDESLRRGMEPKTFCH
jgi:hypothetical protein